MGNVIDGDNQSVFVKLGNEDYKMADIVKCAKFQVKTYSKGNKDDSDKVKDEFVEVTMKGDGVFMLPVESADVKKVNIILDFQDNLFSFTGGKTFKRMSLKLKNTEGKGHT